MNQSATKTLIILTLTILGVLVIVVVYFLIKGQPKKQGNVNVTALKDAGSIISSTVKNLESFTETTIDPAKTQEFADQAETIVKLGQQAVDPLLEQITSSNWKVRWLTVYSLARLGQYADKATKEKIKTAFNNLIKDEPNIALKQQASTWLFSVGEKTTFDMVMECIQEDKIILFSDPPENLKDFCLNTLQYYTGQNFNNAQAWQDWWQKNKDNLTWSEKDNKYLLS